MRVFLASQTFDALGDVEIQADERYTRLGELRRRVQRIKTLDGGYATSDFGVTEADREILLAWTSDEVVDARVDWLVRSYDRIMLSCSLGFYTAAPLSFEVRSNRSRLRLLPLERTASY